MTAERYTAVFTGFLSVQRPGAYPYLTMDGTCAGSGTVTLCAAGTATTRTLEP